MKLRHRPKNMNRFTVTCVFIMLFFFNSAKAQELIEATLFDIIKSAQEESPDYLIAKARAKNSYWNYVSSKSIFKPQLSLNAVLPSVNRSISPTTLPDGTTTFLTSSFMTNSIGLSLNQIVSSTGGNISIYSGLDRLDDFSVSNPLQKVNYLSIPIRVGFVQPLFNYNPFKWDKKRAEINYDASKKRLIEERERAAFQAVDNFFDLYITMLNLEEAKLNSIYLDSLAINSAGRYSVGRISETDLLQIQLSAKNSDGTVASLELNVQNKTERLRDFLGISEEVDFKLTAPTPLSIFQVDKDKALEFARRNRSITEVFRLDLLNAESALESAEKQNGPNLRLNGSIGFNRSANNFTDAYSNLLDQERISLSIDIPILDFGRSKAQKEIAKSNLETTKLVLRQSQVSFERDILVNVEQFELKRNQLTLAEEALEIALKRLDIAKKRFDIGKIDVTNLNIAIQEEQSTRQRYYSSLWELWKAHYTIRNLTLYDFENNLPIE